MPNDTALEGVLVVDLSRVLTGPYASMMLADLGARVIKVERPDTGDDTRYWGPPFVGAGAATTSTYFLSVNRNKESIALDFRDSDDFAVLTRLISRADVLIENFSPGVMDRLRLDTTRLFELNPRLVVLSITGFGRDGPASDRVGYDQIVQGEAGLMSVTGPAAGSFNKSGIPISDVLAGMFGAYGVLAAMRRRERTGRGDVVRTSLLAGSVAVHAFQGTRWLMAGEVPTPIGNRHPTLVPYQAFRCQDGWIQIAIGNDAAWRRCAPLLSIDPDDSRFRTNADRVASVDTLIPMLDSVIAGSSVADWLKVFERSRIPAGEIKSLDQVYADPQVLSQGLLVETAHPELGNVRTPGPPLRFDHARQVEHRPPPLLDEHGQAIRRWLLEETESDE